MTVVVAASLEAALGSWSAFADDEPGGWFRFRPFALLIAGAGVLAVSLVPLSGGWILGTAGVLGALVLLLSCGLAAGPAARRATTMPARARLAKAMDRATLPLQMHPRRRRRAARNRTSRRGALGQDQPAPLTPGGAMPSCARPSLVASTRNQSRARVQPTLSKSRYGPRAEVEISVRMTAGASSPLNEWIVENRTSPWPPDRHDGVHQQRRQPAVSAARCSGVDVSTEYHDLRQREASLPSRSDGLEEQSLLGLFVVVDTQRRHLPSACRRTLR